MAGPRDLDVLLMIVGAVDGAPVRMETVADAYKLGTITAAEARWLQSFSKRSPKSQKRALKALADVTPEAIDAMRTKLEAMAEKFHARYPHSKDPLDDS